MRNRIFGYVTALKRIEEKRKADMTVEETRVASET
jgi:ribosomal protein S17E